MNGHVSHYELTAPTGSGGGPNAKRQSEWPDIMLEDCKKIGRNGFIAFFLMSGVHIRGELVDFGYGWMAVSGKERNPIPIKYNVNAIASIIPTF